MAGIPFPATTNNTGLVRSIGPVALTATFLGVFIGSAIFALSAPMTAAVGGYAPLAYLACAIAVGSVLICFAEASSRVPVAGGPQGFVEAAFGPEWGCLTGALNWASAVLGVAGVAAAAADALGTAITALAGGPVRSPGLPLIAAIGIGSMLWMTAQSTQAEAIGIAIFTVVASLLYRLRRVPAA